MTVIKGDRFHAMGCTVEVRRVAKDQVWADIFVRQDRTNATWTKRQPMPFPANWALRAEQWA